MGKIIIAEMKGFLCAVKPGGTGKICAYPVPVLVFRQHFIYCNGYQFSAPVLEAEPYRCNFAICVGTEDHLYRNIYAQYTFQEKTS